MKSIILGSLGTRGCSFLPLPPVIVDCNTSCVNHHKVFVVAACLEVIAPGNGEQSIFTREKFVKDGLSKNKQCKIK